MAKESKTISQALRDAASKNGAHTEPPVQIKGPKGGSLGKLPPTNGKDSVPVGKVLIGEPGIGTLIAQHIDEMGHTVMSDLKDLIKKPTETVKLAIEEFKAFRDAKRNVVYAANKGARGHAKTLVDRKVNVIKATYGRVLTIMVAIAEGRELTALSKAIGLAEMQAIAAKNKKPGTGTKAQMTSKGFENWVARVKTVAIKPDDTDALRRLEAAFNSIMEALAKHEQQTSIPVRDILTLTAKPKATRHLKAA